MTTLPKVLTLAASAATLGLAVFAATPAAAFDSPYDDQRLAPARQGWVDYNEDGYRGPNGYDRPYGWDRPAYEVRSGAIAVCPPGYHLGQSGGLCWPN